MSSGLRDRCSVEQLVRRSRRRKGASAMWFARSGIGQFLVEPAGQAGRVLVAMTIAATAYYVGGTLGIALSTVAAVIFLEATLDLCLISAVFGGPIRGRDIRAICGRPDEIRRAA